MKIVDPGFSFMHLPDGEFVLRHLELAARTCYKSEDKTSPDSARKLLTRIVRQGHDSVLEHISITVRIVCDRGVSHELVRHRHCGFCLDENTEVVAFRDEDKSGTSQKKWTLKQLLDWQADTKRNGRIKLIRLRSVDESGRIVPGKIKRIIDSGTKEMFEVQCVSGRKILATKEHLFLTTDGWKKLGGLSVGCRLVANGLPALENKEWLERVYIHENNTLKEVSLLAGCCESTVTKALRSYNINKPLSMRKNRKPGHGVKGMHSDNERKRISERMSGAGNHRWVGDNVTASGGRGRANRLYTPDICWGCGTTEKIERHHMDGRTANNTAENIKFLCQKCHKAFHVGQGVLTVFSDEIVSITSAGERKAIDVEMENEPHNFVANGLVVHNSQESTRYANYAQDKFGREITVVRPFFWNQESGRYAIWHAAMMACEDAYFDLVDVGATAQEARSVLPNSLKTEIVTTANIREWRHIFKLRCDKAAHPQMRQIMLPMLAAFAERIPLLFDDLARTFCDVSTSAEDGQQ